MRTKSFASAMQRLRVLRSRSRSKSTAVVSCRSSRKNESKLPSAPIHSLDPSTLTNSIFAATPKPTQAALQQLFFASAIPMVGFGFMDNVVMIQAGQYIDSTLGVTLGLATMTAAAAGQVVSDVSGVVFGGSLERFLTKARWITPPQLTPAQRQLPICRNVIMLGAVVGVIFGCALGATTLLLVDLDARDRVERAKQLKNIVEDMMDAGSVFPLHTRCTIYIPSSKDFGRIQTQTQGTSSRTRIEMLSLGNTAVQDCLSSRQIICSSENNQERILLAPILAPNQRDVLAVLQITGDDALDEACVEKLNIMVNHLAIVLKHISR
jgi:hypothetical protein